MENSIMFLLFFEPFPKLFFLLDVGSIHLRDEARMIELWRIWFLCHDKITINFAEGIRIPFRQSGFPQWPFRFPLLRTSMYLTSLLLQVVSWVIVINLLRNNWLGLMWKEMNRQTHCMSWWQEGYSSLHRFLTPVSSSLGGYWRHCGVINRTPVLSRLLSH